MCIFLTPLLQRTLSYGEGEKTDCCAAESLMIKETTGALLIDSMECERFRQMRSLFFFWRVSWWSIQL